MIRINLDNHWITLDKCTFPEINKRCDQAFNTGSLRAYMNVPYNIPPYTIMEIDNEAWFCSSTCTKYNSINNLYVHNFELIELTALLSGLIVGTKFESGSDKETVDHLLALMQYKYGYELVLDRDMETILKQTHEVSFGQGTTLYDALVEIFGYYKLVPEVKDYIPITIGAKYNTENEFVPHITSAVLSQDVDSYCEILESETSNVTDTTTLNIVKDLTCRSKEYELTADNAIIELPTAVNYVKRAWIKVDRLTASLGLEGLPFRVFNNLHTQGALQMTLQEVIDKVKDEYKNQFINDFKYLASIILMNYNSMTTRNFLVSVSNSVVDVMLFDSNNNTSAVELGNASNGGYYLDISKYITDEKVYNGLDISEKPFKIYYTQGSNTISGLSTSYNDDFWHQIIGDWAGKFVGNIGYREANNDWKHIVQESLYSLYDGAMVKMYYRVEHDGRLDEDPRKHMFAFEYSPIVSFATMSRKSIIPTPFNESMYKPIARTYNQNASMVDFDKFEVGINNANNMQGKPELAIECIVKEGMPNVLDYVLYQNTKWYISNINLKYKFNYKVCQLFLSQNKQQIADVIGVATQYRTTPKPLDSIVDRKMLNVINVSEIPDPYDLYMQISFANGKLLSKRAAMVRYENVAYVVCEALDNVCFDYSIHKNEIPNMDFLTRYTKRINEYEASNEILEIAIGHSTGLGLDMEDSLAIPNPSQTAIVAIKQEYKVRNVKTYKDDRERLIIAIKLIKS